MARMLKRTLTLCLAVGLTSIALGQQPQPRILGRGALLFIPDVQKELKLNEEQLDKLKDTLDKVMAKYKDDFDKFRKTPPTPEEAEKISKAFNEDNQKAIDGVLDTKQSKRFKQIQWQLAGTLAFGDPQLQKELKLSEEQKKKLEDIIKDTEKKLQDLAKNQSPPEKYQAVLKESEEKANGVLSEEQKKNLKELEGPPFAFSRPLAPPAEKR